MLKKRIVFLMLLAFLFVGFGVPSHEAKAASDSGWQLENGNWYYFDHNQKATGWLYEGEDWYYLDSAGKMLTGWYLVGGKWYYSDWSGRMLTGWILDNDTWYYLNHNGAMQTGWLLYGNDWYYLNASGKMQTGWYQLGGLWYFSNESGVMQTRWIKDNGKEYYLDKNGVWNPNPVYLEGRIIVIDPGHGGHDSGATAGGVYEKTINLDVGLKLRDYLTKHNATVHMTRSTDEFISLTDRVAFSNNIEPDAYISIHVNSASGSAAIGIETYHNSQKGILPKESKELASAIQSELLKSTGANDRKVKDANFAVTRGNYTPAILVEMGFITNDSERANLTNSSYQDKIAKGIYNGLSVFFDR
ncbi:N-acetylmuramoyl-L-alanine amidase [Bacillus tuaregi]|uniref:N-acetylmuramoyl-L-alanine amidase n=1 Tax=Bacillus tuaregi TaxID=1816695 RepID=UPI000A03327E|nr:N-acetylmuramoyl-L-alanine amidase [Bacillus tuaregi]